MDTNVRITDMKKVVICVVPKTSMFLTVQFTHKIISNNFLKITIAHRFLLLAKPVSNNLKNSQVIWRKTFITIFILLLLNHYYMQIPMQCLDFSIYCTTFKTLSLWTSQSIRLIFLFTSFLLPLPSKHLNTLQSLKLESASLSIQSNLQSDSDIDG